MRGVVGDAQRLERASQWRASLRMPSLVDVILGHDRLHLILTQALVGQRTFEQRLVQSFRQAIVGRRNAFAKVEQACQTESAADDSTQLLLVDIPARGSPNQVHDARLIVRQKLTQTDCVSQ